MPDGDVAGDPLSPERSDARSGEEWVRGHQRAPMGRFCAKKRHMGRHADNAMTRGDAMLSVATL